MQHQQAPLICGELSGACLLLQLCVSDSHTYNAETLWQGADVHVFSVAAVGVEYSSSLCQLAVEPTKRSSCCRALL